MKAGWQIKKLGAVCSFLNRGISPKYLQTGGICVLNQRCIRDHKVNFEVSRRHDTRAKAISSERLVQAGDVLINSTGEGTLGRVAQVREDPLEPTTVDSHVTIVRPAAGVFFREFFGYALRDIEEDLKKSGEGCGGQTELGRSTLAERFMVRFPSEVSEQQRIVGLLDEAFAGIAAAEANAEKNLQNARALFESHLQSVFTRRDRGWVETALSDVCGFVRGPFGGSLKKSVFVPAGYAVYEQQHAIYDQFDDVRYFIDQAKFKEMNRFELLPDDLIMSCSGTMGRVAIAPKGIKRGIINQALLKLTPSPKILNAFLKSWMESEAFQDALKEYSGGAAIQNVASVKILKEIKVPLPSMADQRRVVEELSAIRKETQRLARIYERKVVALEALKKSLLHRAFSGEL